MELFNRYVLQNIKNKVVLSLGFLGHEVNEARQIKEISAAVKELHAIDIEVNPEIERKYGQLVTGMYCGDLNESNFFDPIPAEVMERLDLILMTEVLEHIHSPIRTLKYVKSRKQQKTKILISVPNGASLGRTCKSLIGTNCICNSEDSMHFCVFSRRCILNVAKEAGLTVEDIRSYAATPLRRLVCCGREELGTGFFLTAS